MGCMAVAFNVHPSHGLSCGWHDREWPAHILRVKIHPGSRPKKKPAPNPFGSDAGKKKLATTYSHTAFRRTTIGAGAFHFRVRDGIGWFRTAMITRILKCLEGNSDFYRSRQAIGDLRSSDQSFFKEHLSSRRSLTTAYKGNLQLLGFLSYLNRCRMNSDVQSSKFGEVNKPNG